MKSLTQKLQGVKFYNIMKNMRVFLLLCLIFWGVNVSYAYDLILPKEKKSIVSTKYAFFVGKANKSEVITINDEKVYIAPNGAFAHSVKLKDGENRVLFKSNYNTQIYRFYKEKVESAIKPDLVEFDSKVYSVKKDNTPLRVTPIDYGMNRISHLFKDTKLIINGQKGQFYRVFLSKNKEAWIDKDSVVEYKESINPNFITMNSQTFKNASKHTIEFTEKLPYTIEESDSEIMFKIYNPFISEDSVYTVNIRKPDKYTYETHLHNGVYLFKVCELPKSETQSLDGLNIIVDAGHGGNEKGAIGCLGDKEKDINLKIAEELRNNLCLMGANVIMTRECDANVSLDDRVKIAKENCSNIFVSIHLNSIPDIEMNVNKHKGTSVYYYNKNSKLLAQTIKDSVVNSLGTRNDGVKTASFAVLRPTDYIGVLVEVAYMTNPNDSVLYTKEDFPSQTAKAIAEGILQYVLCD